MADDLVFVGVKLPRPLFVRLQAYAKQHRFSVSELLRDGLEWRLGKEDIDLVVDWAGDLRVGKVLLELALEGRLDLSVIDGKVHVSAKGRKRLHAVKDFA